MIRRDGKPVAALVQARLFERIRRLQARFDGLCERIKAGDADALRSGFAHPASVPGRLVAARRPGRTGLQPLPQKPVLGANVISAAE